jgi:DNA-binding transcriptional ArsR family regulator
MSDRTFRALADPTRRRILELLARGAHPVKELGARFPLSQPALSQHLRVLREAGLVRVRRDGRRRVYSLHAGPLRSAHEWLGRFERSWLLLSGRGPGYALDGS